MKRSFDSRSLLTLFLVAFLLVSCHDIQPDTATLRLKNGNVYRGTLSDGRPDGYGVLTMGDSTVYAGQWKHGQRSGRGIMHDSLGHRIVGYWMADTLVTGLHTDSTGIYQGTFNHQGMFAGYGWFLSNDLRYYRGHWRDGLPEGFGFSLIPGKRLRVGDWHQNRFLGERLEYTADRVYGIDVSRFQHEVGRHKYAIDWSKVRITHLGTLSRKRVSGTVDYPVSFCYIKSTEGKTVHNAYYRSDYTAARRQGIVCGSYHFFSTTTPAADQARNFLSHSTFSKGDFPPVLDVEPSDEQIRKMGGATALFKAVRIWMQMVERHVGVRPILYISQSFVNRYLPSAPDIKRDYNVWIARYGEFKPDVHLAVWQLCPDGRVQGIRSEVDINVFNGYRSEFEEFCRTQCVK